MARLLIIDDDVTLRQALTKHLEHAGHEVRQAADGDAGIKAYERHAADVVIVDIFMPGQGGLQTIARLRRACRAAWPSCPSCLTCSTSSTASASCPWSPAPRASRVS